MNAGGHLNFSIYSAIILGCGYQINHLPKEPHHIATFGIGVLVGALLPDVDHQNSRFGKIFQFWRLNQLHKWFASKFLSKKKRHFPFKHGGVTHTVLANAWIFILGYIIKDNIDSIFWAMIWWSFISGVGFGYMTHLYIDHVTGNRLNMLYWPFYIRHK